MPTLMERLAAALVGARNDGSLALPLSRADRLAAAVGGIPDGFEPAEADSSLVRAPREERFGARPSLLPSCANPRCSAGWLRLWRSRATPVFEGGWSCSDACTRALVETALGREMDARGASGEGHRHRIPLGLVMVMQGWITPEDLRRALEAQRAAGRGRLGWWLAQAGVAGEETVTRALALQWNCPVLPVTFPNVEALAPALPRFFADAFGALPLRVAAGKILYLGFESGPDPALALAVERMTGLRVECGLVEETPFNMAHTGFLKTRFPEAELIEAEAEQALASGLAQAVERFRPVESRLVRVHECFWLRMWLRPQRGAMPERGSVRDLIGAVAAG